MRSVKFTLKNLYRTSSRLLLELLFKQFYAIFEKTKIKQNVSFWKIIICHSFVIPVLSFLPRCSSLTFKIKQNENCKILSNVLGQTNNKCTIGQKVLRWQNFRNTRTLKYKISLNTIKNFGKTLNYYQNLCLILGLNDWKNTSATIK